MAFLKMGEIVIADGRSYITMSPMLKQNVVRFESALAGNVNHER